MHKGIALGPIGNLQGSVKFYCLNMGQVLKCRSFTPGMVHANVGQNVTPINFIVKQYAYLKVMFCYFFTYK
jgi:hypothetical protein